MKRLARLLPFVAALPGVLSAAETAGPARQALDALSKGADASAVYDRRASRPGSVEADDEAALSPLPGPAPVVSQPAADDDPGVIATPVVRAAPRKEQFQEWAGRQGAHYGMKWGAIGGTLLGLLVGFFVGGPAGVILGVGILAAGAVGGWVAGYHLGKKKAQEING